MRYADSQRPAAPATSTLNSTIPAKAHRPAYGSDGDYWSKPNRESIFTIVHDLMHEAKPGKYPRIM